MFLWSPAPGSALGCLLHRLCGLSAALWEEMRRPRSQNASQTHFLETRALSQNQFLWEMECQQSMSYTQPSPGHNSGGLSILLPESICGQWAHGWAIINSLSKCWLPTRPDLCQKYSCPGRPGPIMAQWAGLPGPNTISDSLNQSPHLKIRESIGRGFH